MDKLKSLLKNRPWIILGIILFLGVLLRLYNLNQSLWLDEVWSSTHVTLGNVLDLTRVSLLDKVAPFYRIFMFFWIKLFGDWELSLRTPSLLFGVLSIFLTYLIAVKSAGRQAAVLASFLLCVSAAHIWYSREATCYSMLLFLSLTSIFSLYKLEDCEKKAVWYSIYFLSLFLAVFTHWFLSVYLLSTSLTSLFKTGRVRRNILGLNSLILSCLAVHILLKTNCIKLYSEDFYLRPFTFLEFWMLFFNWFLFGNALWTVNPYKHHLSLILHNPGMLAAQIFFCFIFLNGLVSSLKEKNPYARDNFLYLFTLPLAVLLLSYAGFKHIYIERYLLAILPFFYIFLSKGAVSLKSRPLKMTSVAALAIFSTAALIGLQIKGEAWTVYKQNPDWRSAARYFIDERENSKQPLLIFSTALLDPLTYYKEKLIEEEREIPHFLIYGEWKKSPYEVLDKDKISLFYLIENKIWPTNFDELLKSAMKDPEFRLIGTRSFKGLLVFKFAAI